MHGSSHLTIDLSLLLHNIKKMASACGSVMVMVKANAYGTDAVFISKFLQLMKCEQIPFLGVSHITEALHLRQAGITLPIFVLSAPTHQAELAAEHCLSCAVSSFEEVACLNTAAKNQGRLLDVHLHLDTGMGRFGVAYKEGLKLYQAILESSHLNLEGVMTHFAAADSPELDPFTQKQHERFKAFLDLLPQLPRWIHAANSAGVVRFPLPFCNLARVGLAMTGFGHCLETMEPALRFTTTLSSISWLEKGDFVSYNCSYRVDKDRMKVGVVPIGYHDGFPRSLSGKGYVLIRGKKAPMIGMVCMDFMMIDLSHIEDANVGDQVLLFGPHLRPELVASWAQTDVREILAGLAARVRRLWTNPPILSEHENETVTERLPSSFFTIERDPSAR